MKEITAQVPSYLEKVLKDKYFKKKKHDEGWYFNATMSRLMPYAEKRDFFYMVIGMISALVSGVLVPLSGLAYGSMSNAFVGFIKSSDANNSETDSLEQANGNDFMSQLLTQCTTLMYFGIVSLLFNFLMTYAWDIVNVRQAYKLREVFFAQVMRQDPAWHEQKPDNVNLTTLMTDNVEKIKLGLGSKIPILVQAFITCAAGFVVGFYVNWKLTLVALAGSPIVLGSSMYHMTNVIKRMQAEFSAYSDASTIAMRTLTSFQIVSSLGNRIGEISNFNKAVKEGLEANRWVLMSSAIAGGCAYGAVYLMYSAVIWYGGILLKSGEVDAMALFSVIRSVVMGALGVGAVIVNLTFISEAIGSAAGLLETINNTPQVDPYSRDGLIPSSVKGEVELKDVYFTYPTRKNVMVLCGLSLKVPEGKVVALVGSSGSGKSTIINLILRFYDPISGTVMFDGIDLKKMNVEALRSHIGVVSQEPVLFDVTVEENIRYGRTDATLEEIEKAAKLAYAHDFIQLLPNGYQSHLGERGTKLSGGQKQRIAIARALVRDPKVLLLDEATSALDSQSEAIVQASLESAMRGRTTIIVAHRLSTVKNADVIHVMRKGKIIESGKHEELLKAKGAYYDLVHSQQIKEPEEQKIVDSSPSDTIKRDKPNSMVKTNKKSFQGKETDSFPLKKLLSLCHPWLSAIGIFSSILLSTATSIFSFFFGQLVTASALPLEQIQDAFNLISIYFLVLGLLSAAFKIIMVIALTRSTETVVGDIRTKMFRTLLSQEYDFFEDVETSPLALTTILARDPPKLKGIAGDRFGVTLSLTLTAIITIFIAFVTFWEVAILLMILLPMVTLAGYAQFKISMRAIRREKTASLLSTKLASECFENMKTIQFLGLQEYSVQQFSQSLEVEKKNEYRAALYFALSFSITSSLQFFALGASYLLGGKLISLGIGSTSNLFTAVTGVTVSMGTTANCLAFIQDSVKCKNSLADVVNLVYKEKKLDPFDQTGQRPEFKGRITFSDVWFSYKSKPNHPVLKGLNLDILPGQTVALVGNSGCGKSTTINLIERFYNPTRGKITIDGVDIRDINVDYLRKHIGLVTQEPTLFNISIRDNIVYGSEFWERPVSEEDIVKAATDANIHDFITCLPQGYDTKVGGRGCLLSGGQKQRLAIARALVRNPTMLLLDEATSALDTESEKVVQAAIENALKGRTSVVVAHRLSTIRNADVIVFLEDGEVVEKGTHDELVELRGKYYDQLTKQ